MRPTTAALLLSLVYLAGVATPIAIVALAVRGMTKPVGTEEDDTIRLRDYAEASHHHRGA